MVHIAVDEAHKVIDLNTSKAKKAAQVVAKEFTGSVSFNPMESTLHVFNGVAHGIEFEDVVSRLQIVLSYSDNNIEALLQKK